VRFAVGLARVAGGSNGTELGREAGVGRRIYRGGSGSRAAPPRW
jgi:hypothetical protein